VQVLTDLNLIGIVVVVVVVEEEEDYPVEDHHIGFEVLPAVIMKSSASGIHRRAIRLKPTDVSE
jgi:hypothetical protein